MRAWNCCWNCWKMWGKGIILLACVAGYVAPAKAAGCADLQPFQTAVNEARKKEDAASDAKNRLHDSDRPKPVPAEIRQKLPDKPVWTRADYDNAANQARADAESHVRRLTENLEKINRLRADGAETQKKIKALLDKIDALPDDDKPKSERALGAARQALAAAQRERDEKAPALQAQIARSEQAVKSRLAIPGALGLAVSTPGEIADAMQKLENTDPAEAGLVSPQIIAMRAEIAAQDKIIAECARKADGLIEKPDEWNANNDKLEKAKADKTAAERALAVAQNEAHRQALGLLNQLFKERRELTDLGQAIEKHLDEITRLKKTPGAAGDLQEQIEVLEREYANRVRASIDTLYGSKVESLLKSLELEKDSSQERLEAWQERLRTINEYAAYNQAADKASLAREERERAEQRLQEALNVAQQDAAAALARVQTAARAARDTYVEEIGRRNGQLETARKFLDEWNDLSRKRDSLFKEAKALKDRGQLTEAQRARIAAAWAPVRARRDQFIARDYTGEKLTQIINQAIPARKRDAQNELVIALRAAREGLKPFDCAEFPAAQKYLATLTKSINYHDKEPATPNSGHSTVGFMAIPDLVLPGADAERKPPIIAAAPKPAPNPAPSATPNERTFNVSAGKWHSTGITLKKGQSFDVKAS